MQLYISTCAAMSTLAIWCRVVHSRDVSPYIFGMGTLGILELLLAWSRDVRSRVFSRPTSSSEADIAARYRHGILYSSNCYNIGFHG